VDGQSVVERWKLRVASGAQTAMISAQAIRV
jgi:hypothetical protein